MKMFNNYDWVILGPKDTISNKQKIFQKFFGFIEDFDLFQDIFSKYTELYGLIIIDNKLKSKKITDKIFKIDIDSFKRTKY
jgi:hypothetical protein